MNLVDFLQGLFKAVHKAEMAQNANCFLGPDFINFFLRLLQF
jgi:hypothetical protein